MAMIWTAGFVLVVLAVVFLTISALGKLPLWPAVLCLALERIVALGGPR